MREPPIASPARQTSIVQFDVDGQRIGLYATEVVEVLRAAAAAPLPGAPAVVTGLLNVRGALVPVFDVRSRFGLPPRPIRHTDHLILANTSSRRIAIGVDRVHGIVAIPSLDLQVARDLPAASKGVAGVARMGDGMMVIWDLGLFLTEAEAAELDAALAC